MSRRITPIITNQIYHIFNRGIAGQPIFSSTYDYQRLLELISYYRFSSPDLRFSFYKRLPLAEKQTYLERMKQNKPLLIEIYAYCLMPNHYHLLVKELLENGIRKFIANMQNSYAKYFNTKRKRQGSLFTEMFKNVRVEDEEQFVHLARYIHLNPLTTYVISKKEELDTYPWSSFPGYFNNSPTEFLETNTLLSLYKANKDLETFTKDQIDYQRQIHNFTYLVLE